MPGLSLKRFPSFDFRMWLCTGLSEVVSRRIDPSMVQVNRCDLIADASQDFGRC